MEELIEFIKNNTNNTYWGIKIVSVIYDKDINNLEIKVVYKSNFDFTLELRQNLIQIIKNFIGRDDLKVELKTKKSLLDKVAILKLITYYMQNNYASIFSSADKDDIEIEFNEDVVLVKLKFIYAFYSYLLSIGFEKEIKEFLERNYFQQFIINLEEKIDNFDLNEILDTRISEVTEQIISEVPEVIKYKVLNITKFIGIEIGDEVPALNSFNSPMANVCVAGEVNFITKRTFKSKRKNMNGEFEEKEFYNFTIDDGYGKLTCVYFPTKETIQKFAELKNNVQILVNGDLEEFNKKLSLKVKSICYCELPKREEKQVNIKKENKNYKFVFPKPYVNMSQTNMFDVVLENTNKFLKENDCVVFDLETTGLEASLCEIIEIGACKVRDGKIIETFSCLVKPKGLIPEEITQITGITNEMVKDCYGIEDVLQDFYKFTRNSVLVAYNIAFDYKFIYLAGSSQGYIFDNKQIDCLVLAKTKLRGLKNYRLKTVVDKLNIPLENAHRAVNDAIATAEAFIKLADDNM